MKQIFLAISLLIGFCSYGQDYIGGSCDFSFDRDTKGIGVITPGILSYGFFDRNVKIVSKHDTTIILYKGTEDCNHLFAVKQVYEGLFSNYGYCCLVEHGELGCPDKWSNEKKICTICLKHIQIKETRTAIKLQDDYEIALKKLNELINNKTKQR